MSDCPNNDREWDSSTAPNAIGPRCRSKEIPRGAWFGRVGCERDAVVLFRSMDRLACGWLAAGVPASTGHRHDVSIRTSWFIKTKTAKSLDLTVALRLRSRALRPRAAATAQSRH